MTFGGRSAFAVGGMLSIAAARELSRLPPSRQVSAAAAGLMEAALVYPVARAGRGTDPAVVAREWAAVLATVAVFAGAVGLPSNAARLLTAGGWLAHAGFDHGHARGATSRLPTWYPALCAGFDVGVAVLLCAQARRTRLGTAIDETPLPSG